MLLNGEHLVGLEREAPFWMLQDVVDGGLEYGGILGFIACVEGLETEFEVAFGTLSEHRQHFGKELLYAFCERIEQFHFIHLLDDDRQ